MSKSKPARQQTGRRKSLIDPKLTREIAALRKEWRHGQPVPPALKQRALDLCASGVKPGEVAQRVGVTYESVRLWRKQFDESQRVAVSPDSASAPVKAAAATASQSDAPASRDTAQGLSAVEVAGVLELKRKHPSMGPAQIRAQLKRFRGWRLSVRAIARVLVKNGFELVHVTSTPKGQECTRWEAPRRNALWQLDFVELRVGPVHVSLLLVLDDFSRYCVAFELMTEPTSEAVVAVLERAIRQHGKPEAIYTDRGGAFLAWRNASSLECFLERELIDHHVGPSYRPQGRGKVESLAGTIQRELWNVVHFESVDVARDKVAEFFRFYNEARAHMGIDGLTPADRYFGRWEQVKARVDAATRGRLQALSAFTEGRLTEEIAASGPAEVLRLAAVDGHLELRFLGHRVDLGPIQA
ncbi:MAG: transposase family protein [Candidatus Dormibacteraeota bacterium]|nr:transposase family protein [Candidatus Dormibacteraeota bacterium]